MIASIPVWFSVLPAVGLVLGTVSRTVTAGVDGLFVVLVCLSVAVIFGLHALPTAADAGYLRLPARFQKAHK